LVDEVTYLVNLLEENWDAACHALETTNGNGTITDTHAVHPIIMDIRSMNSGRATDSQSRGKGGHRINTARKKEVRADANSDGHRITYSNDVIVIMETGNSVEYPTLFWDTRDETYNMNISIRTRQDDRVLNDGSTRIKPTGDSFGKDRIRSLYLIVRYIIESMRRGWIKNGVLQENMNQLMFKERTESNDKKNRVFGYKINVVMKRLAQAV
jgi:hypothetical protein